MSWRRGSTSPSASALPDSTLVATRLLPILGEYPLAGDSAIRAVYPSVRSLPVRVRLFIHFLKQSFGQPPPYRDTADAAEGQ
ncbi:hypothetical protein [Skermanella pratensis]|uniref:hypothetical protein n=1 Tax=Skermanella pratensis TaxID=2233999 RepID=UPI001FE957D7|nr:hypothetical protein [Skermanella pratensis]